MVLVPAASLGKSGYESKDALDGDADFLARLESLRRDAALLMGLGDVSNSVIPKIAVLAKPQGPSGVSSRYFVPQNCHAAHAATGAICIAGATLIEGSIAHEIRGPAADTAAAIRVEHPKGAIEIDIKSDASYSIDAAYLVRTARPIFTGQIQVPSAVWPVEHAMDRAA